MSLFEVVFHDLYFLFHDVAPQCYLSAAVRFWGCDKFELEGHDINYRPRTSVKGQILADFIVEHLEDDTLDIPMEDREELPDPWILFTDGSSCIDGSGAGLIITNPDGTEFTYALRFRFNATNNEAEYEALIAGLRIARKMGMQNLQANKVKNLASTFKEFSIKQVPRGENKKADTLSKIASTSFAHLSKQVLVEELKEKSIDEKEVLTVIEEEEHTWMTPIYEYVTEEILPEEKRKARAIRHKAGSMQSRPRSVVAKALRSGYYWPTMHTGARNLIRECSGCQGIDIAGPFSEGPGKVKFLIVAMDYFTKWIDAKLVATITGAQVKKFVWDNIVCRFGLPGKIISDNGKQFRDNPFKDWCENLCIRQCFAFVKHPQANSLVERANRSLGEGIKPRLEERSKNWLEEVSHVIWAHRTMIKSSNEETLFLLTYGAETVIPVEIGMPTLRTAEVDMIKNNEALGINLDLLEEKRDQAAIQEARSKPRWRNTIMPGFEAQASVWDTSSTGTTKQATRKTEASLDLSGRDHMKLRKHWAKEHTSLETATEIPFRKHGMSATLRNVICMKCKHLP
ncbi:reverse transcriptase domain-containing protein [Tanacetum coccineum]